MTELPSNVALAVAALDLKLVKLLRGAMGAPGNTPVGGLGYQGPAATYESGDTIQPSPRFEPRRVIHPTPRYESRPVIHPDPRIEPRELLPVDKDPAKAVTKPVIQPPWKILPWPEHEPVRRIVKVANLRPDTSRTGRMIDFFV